MAKHNDDLRLKLLALGFIVDSVWGDLRTITFPFCLQFITFYLIVY